MALQGVMEQGEACGRWAVQSGNGEPAMRVLGETEGGGCAIFDDHAGAAGIKETGLVAGGGLESMR